MNTVHHNCQQKCITFKLNRDLVAEADSTVKHKSQITRTE